MIELTGWRILFAPVLTVLIALTAATAGEPGAFASVARKTFADLLKVSLDPPEVSVTVAERKTEDGILVEDLSWESLDGERAPALVMRPVNATGRLPAIICLHGSSGSRESMSTNTFGTGSWTRYGRERSHTRLLGWARELARQGYVELALTQRGLDRRRPGINDQSNALLAQGRTGMGAILHEIQPGRDLSRKPPGRGPETDRAAGLSFGGITAFYVWLIDERVAAAAPICGGVGSVDALIRVGRPDYHSTYWFIPNMLEKGDQADFAAAMAPRPLMVWAPTEDIGMPREGVDRFREVVAPAYERAGRSSTLLIHQPPGEHTFSKVAFEAMTKFFKTHLMGQ